jgi:hypothetical protein
VNDLLLPQGMYYFLANVLLQNLLLTFFLLLADLLSDHNYFVWIVDIKVVDFILHDDTSHKSGRSQMKFSWTA